MEPSTLSAVTLKDDVTTLNTRVLSLDICERKITMFDFLKPKTPAQVQEDLLKAYIADVEHLKSSIIQAQDTLAYFKASLAHAEQRVLELTPVQHEGI